YRTRVAHEHNAILSHHGVVAALECSETRVEFMKLGGIEREDEDAAERAVRHRPATADGEERRVGHARDEDFRDINTDVAFNIGAKIVAIGDVEIGRNRVYIGRGQGTPVAVENPY